MPNFEGLIVVGPKKLTLSETKFKKWFKSEAKDDNLIGNLIYADNYDPLDFEDAFELCRVIVQEWNDKDSFIGRDYGKKYIALIENDEDTNLFYDFTRFFAFGLDIFLPLE